MTTGKLIPLYEQVARAIEQRIETGRFRIGEKIPSIRGLCEEFSVADVTAKRALRELSQRGLIKTVTGSGAFVAERQDPHESAAAAKSNAVAFIKVGMHPVPVFVYEIDLIQRELAAMGMPMIYSTAPEDSDAEAALAQARSAGATCLLVFPPHRGEFGSSEYMRLLRRAGLPLLVIESRSATDSYISADTERATAELVRYLYEEGHRQICLATVFSRKIKGFNDALAVLGDPSVHTTIIGEHGRSEADAHELSQQILELTPRPTAVIASSDQVAGVMIHHFMAAGLRVPEDISVVTFGDHPQFAGLSPLPLTVVRHPYHEVAQEVRAWVANQQSRVGNRRRFRREISGSLIVRDSSGPAPAL